METVLKAIADWIKGILTAGIMSNLSGLFDDVNAQVGNIAQQVGTKPSSFEPRVFAMIEALSRNVVCLLYTSPSPRDPLPERGAAHCRHHPDLHRLL